MLDLALKNRTLTFKLTVKTTVAVMLVLLAVALPQLTHAVGGAAAGSVYMPMYLPALLAGLALGWKFGLAVGLLSPAASFAFTVLVFGTPMPVAERLPYMMLELGAYGLITGLFSAKVQKSPLLCFPAVMGAQLCGRAIYVIYNLIAGRDFAGLWASVQASMPGLYLQAIIAPLAAIAIFMVYKNEQKTE